MHENQSMMRRATVESVARKMRAYKTKQMCLLRLVDDVVADPHIHIKVPLEFVFTNQYRFD